MNLKINSLFSIIFVNYLINGILFYKNKLDKIKIANTLIKIYTDLFDYTRDGYIKPRFSNKNIDYSYIQKKFSICICSICKNENLYIKEFVEYYLKLGIDKLIIYDNNENDGENVREILTEYIRNNFVDVIDVRGLSSIQIPIYNYCYRKNKNFYDWIGFIDIDEYLFIEDNQTIKKYLYNESFNKCQTVFFNWIMYNDNNLVKYDNRSLRERFTFPSLKSTQGKSFVRGNIDNLIITTTQIPGINIFHFCNSNGELIYPKNFMNNRFERKPKAYIKHYYTKTAEEFCYKLKKGHAHFHKNHKQYQTSIRERIKLFFKLNKKTNEKEKILLNCLK